jgi:hypothetical protein
MNRVRAIGWFTEGFIGIIEELRRSFIRILPDMNEGRSPDGTGMK